jgi:hypothetical protein
MSPRPRKSTGTRVAAAVTAPVLALTLLAPSVVAATTTSATGQTQAVRDTEGDNGNGNDGCLLGGLPLLGGLLCDFLSGGK